MPSLLDNSDLSLLALYALICIGIGVWTSRKQKTDEYLIAGRKLGTFSFIATVVATYIGGGVLVAYTAYVYEFGISAIAFFLGVSVSYVVFIWYAKIIRREGKEREFHTLSDWFYWKFDKRTGVLSAIIISIVFFGGLIAQFIAGSSILSSISGLSYEKALLFSGSIILIYLFLGGFKSVVKTDIFQYFVILILFVLIGSVMLQKGEVATELLDVTRLGPFLTIAFVIYGVFSIFVSADLWQRIYAAKSEQVVKRGLIGSAILLIITGFAVSLIGLAAASNFPGIEPQQAVAYGLAHLLPAGLLSLGLVLIFASIMSTADTLIFVLSTNIAKDYFGQLIFKKIDEKQLVKLTRTFVVITSILGVMFAYFFRDIIPVVLTLASVSLAAVPPIIGSFHWNIKPRAAFAAMLSGLIYVMGLVLAGYIIPEAAVGSIVVSVVFLLIFQFFPRK